MNIRLHLFSLGLLLLGTIPLHAQRSSDSLLAAERQLNSIVIEARELSNLIATPDDQKQYTTDLNLLAKRMERLEQDYPQILTDDDLSQIYRLYLNAMQAIEDKLSHYRHEQILDSLQSAVGKWCPRFDSLLVDGQAYANKKEADSVRMVKSQAAEWWQRLVETHNMYADFFNSDDELKQYYSHIDQQNTEIRNLSEKEKIQLKDILLVGGVLAAVLAVVGGMIGTYAKNKKLLKKAQETPTIEL